MISVDTWPQSAIRLYSLAHRFRKFVLVGVFGLLVNVVGLFLLHEGVNIEVVVASPIAIFGSMIVTFALNERWTWHDRGSGRVIHRAMSYVPINVGGLIINWSLLYMLHEQFDWHYQMANLTGAAVAAIWNFTLNNVVTWRE